ncbi:uncharacterized protein BO97DRAFT_455889 [Aspergillus homomorphus CBS 101889]|uniref:Uncharacterized protein n=1 Tax=Aspergillus homomorphus (strain CBS 101889) TaxID=1450537 RepID=A0A395I897_ASPHC|nr:hypothetical protein BO97DRAFT_455889 [Aspergillus homomorphus CBS 101889]RAL16367.1 hypothetical protein BO97DRAFT_455889 [Aspergillus homomorphus CBS 101889]
MADQEINTGNGMYRESIPRLPALPEILRGIELEEPIDRLPSIRQILSSSSSSSSSSGGPARSATATDAVVRRQSGTVSHPTPSEARAHPSSASHHRPGQPRFHRLLPPPYGSFYPSRAATIPTHPLLLQAPRHSSVSATTAGPKLTAVPATPVIFVTNPNGDHRALRADEYIATFPDPPPVYSSSQPGRFRSAAAAAAAAEEQHGQVYDILAELRTRNTATECQSSPPHPILTASTYNAFPAEKDPRGRMRSGDSLAALPRRETVTQFVDQPARAARCELCNGRNESGMSRCTACPWQCCHGCTVKEGYLREHVWLGEVHIGPITRDELLGSGAGKVTPKKKNWRTSKKKVKPESSQRHGNGSAMQSQMLGIGTGTAVARQTACANYHPTAIGTKASTTPSIGFIESPSAPANFRTAEPTASTYNERELEAASGILALHLKTHALASEGKDLRFTDNARHHEASCAIADAVVAEYKLSHDVKEGD